MNTPVSSPLAKLLKEKGFEYQYQWNLATDNFPTIADVVMWFYEKHGIWISVYQYKDHAADNNDPFSFRSNATGSKEFNNPTEAYEAAIELALNKLI